MTIKKLPNSGTVPGWAILFVLCAGLAAEKTTSWPLAAIGKIPLTAVHGRIDHLAADIYHGRLFLAALGNDSVEVLDIRTNAPLTSIHGVREPQGVGYVKSTDRLFVTSAADGTVRVFDGTSLKQLSSLHLGQDADNVRVDAAHGRVYVGYGNGALAVLDAAGKRLGDVTLKGHPESFQIADRQPRLFVNVPDAHMIAVVDTKSLQMIGEWPVKDGLENFPMALDEDNGRVFVACRRPARLLVMNMETGAVLARMATAGDADDLFYDPIHAQLYAMGGQGKISIYKQETPDRYTEQDSIATVAGARTGLFVPEWNRLFVAVREFGAHTAEIRMYQPQQAVAQQPLRRQPVPQ